MLFDVLWVDVIVVWMVRLYWMFYVLVDCLVEWVQEFFNQFEVVGFYGIFVEVYVQEWFGVGLCEFFFMCILGGFGELVEGEFF